MRFGGGMKLLVIPALALLSLHTARAAHCLGREVRQNMTVQVGECGVSGTRPIWHRISPGSHECKIDKDHNLFVPPDGGPSSCTTSCPAGKMLEVTNSFLMRGSLDPEVRCKVCPQNTYSVGGGQRIETWPKPPLDLPGVFEAKCYGFNQSRFLETQMVSDGWTEGYGCNGWNVKHDGTSIASGWNGATSKVRSELRMRLNLRRKGSVTFSFRVDADSSSAAGSDCPWMEGHTGTSQWECMDGSMGNLSTDCNDHGGRGKCPSSFPWMCGQPTECADELDFCCGTDCEAFGSNRLCPGSGGLQVMMCNETRLPACHPMPLRKPPYSRRFYVSSQLQWMTTTLEVEPGWQEIVWVYSRDGAVLGNDIAEILDVEWEGTDLADTECTLCPEGKVSVAGSKRCSSCLAGHAWDASTHTCKPCTTDTYALEGFSECKPRPLCTENDYYAQYSDCHNAYNMQRQRTWLWAEPKVCHNGASLPHPISEFVACEECKLGETRQGEDCVACSEGLYGTDVGKCEVCPAGREAIREMVYSSWGHAGLPEAFSTGCIGMCAGTGWRAMGERLESGTANVAPFQTWLEMKIQGTLKPTGTEVEAQNLDRTTSLSFDYGVTCGPGGVPHFEFTVDGRAASSDKIITTACGVSGQTVSLVLSPGPHTLRWIFSVEPGEGHQGAAPPQSSAGVPVATISSVRVEDSISGAASSCNPCPAGTYAPSPTSRCAPCPKGTTSSPAGGGGTSCVPCPADTFSPVAGSPKCRPCGSETGTGGRVGAAACSANFTFEDAGGSVSVDLSFIKGVYGPVVVYDAFGMGKTGTLYFSVASVLSAGSDGSISALVGGPYPEGCIGTFSCMTTMEDDSKAPSVPGDTYSWPRENVHALGGEAISQGAVRGYEKLPPFLKDYDAIVTYDSSGTRWRIGGGVTVVLSGGSECERKVRRRTKIYMICDVLKGQGTPRLLSPPEVPGEDTECARHILWETAFGCPQCTGQSFAELATACVGGFQNVTFRMAEECFQGQAVPPPRFREKCTIDWQSMLSTADYAAMAFVVVGALVTAVMLLKSGIKYKRLYERYSMLEEGGEVVLDSDQLG